jgi:hypothetical protein
MIKNIRDLKINTVLLESKGSTSSNPGRISVSTSLNLVSNSIAIEKYNFRLFVSLTQESSGVLDFLSQRYNEFLDGKAGSIAQDQFNQFLMLSLGDKVQYLSNNSPFSPYSTNMESRNLVITRGVSSYGTGGSIPEGIIIFDLPLENLILSPRSGQNILKTVNLSLPNVRMDQISCYCYVYDNKIPHLFSEEASSNFSLVTGMGHVARGTYKGTHISYDEIFPDRPLVSMVNPKQTISPEGNNLKQINLVPTEAVIKGYSHLSDSMVRLFQTPRLGQSKQLNKVIKRSNYFTDFWLSRDQKENNRFIFSFDIQNFLADNSLFPFVYKNNLLNHAIFSDSEEFSPHTPSSVSSVEVFRHNVSSTGLHAINDLGTMGPGYPDRTTLPIPTENIKKVQISLPSAEANDLASNSLTFFEGCDKFSTADVKDRQIDESFQYSVKLSVLDNSPQLLRRLTDVLYDKKRILSSIRDYISLNTSKMFGRKPLYDVAKAKTTQDIRSININIDGEQVLAYDEIMKILLSYQEIVGSLSAGAGIDLTSYYKNFIEANQGIINVQLITDIEMLLDLGIRFLHDKLVSIFPSDPFGMLDSIRKNTFDQNMSRSIKNNVLLVENRYKEVYKTGEDNHLGIDYIFGDIESDSFSEINIDSYDTRRVMEFNKYFFKPSGGALVSPVGAYEEVSYAYMTPRIIKTPSRSIIDQAKVSTATLQSVEYDFDRYAELYSDLVSIKNQQKIGMVYPSLSSIALQQSKNNQIYSDIRTLLSEDFSISIGESAPVQFSPPRVSVDKVKSTIYNFRDKENCGTNAGPALIKSVIGTDSDPSSAAFVYLDAVDLNIKNQNTQLLKGDIDQIMKKQDLKDRAIRLPFAILGELTIDKTIAQTDRNVQPTFNSMTALSKILGISEQNLPSMLQGSVLSHLPAQLQSMIIIASTTQPLAGESSEGNEILDARRFTLNIPGVTEGDDLVSFFEGGKVISTEGNKSYSLIPDPMKSYATFLTLWMNYRQIAVVEYLSGFGTIIQPHQQVQNDFNPRRLKLSTWEPMSPTIAEELRNQPGKILCRTRLLNADDYLNMIKEFTTSEQQHRLVNYFEQKQVLQLPTYNKYFYISGIPSQPETTETVTVEEVSVTSPNPLALGY